MTYQLIQNKNKKSQLEIITRLKRPYHVNYQTIFNTYVKGEIQSAVAAFI